MAVDEGAHSSVLLLAVSMPTAARARVPPGAFFDAAFQGDLERMRKMLDDGHDVNDHPPMWKSVYQPTALAYAVWGNQPEAVRLLLDSRADPNQADGDGNYHPLHWASYKSDHAECAAMLVEAGADPTVTTARGFTPLQLARGNNSNVSSKPGVASVLEEALANPRTPWRRPPDAAAAASDAATGASTSAATTTPAGSNSASSSDAAAPASDAPVGINSAPAALPMPAVPQTWSPLQAAAEAAAAVAAANAAHTFNHPGGDEGRPARQPQAAGGAASDAGAADATAAALVAPGAAAAAQNGRDVATTRNANAEAWASLADGRPPPTQPPRVPASGLSASMPELPRPLRARGADAAPSATGGYPAATDARGGGASTVLASSRPWLLAGGAVVLAGVTANALSVYGAPGEGGGVAEGVNTTGDAATDLVGKGMVGAASKLGLAEWSLLLLLVINACLLAAIWSNGPLRTLLLQKLGVQAGMRRSASFVPPQFVCPITEEVMRDPVTTSDGHTFERSSIEKWFREHSTSPMTGMRLEHTGLAPAIALRQLIENEMRSRGVPYP